MTNGTVLGVDVSSYQPTENWPFVRSAGVERCYVKATEGITVTDPLYFAHMNGARNAGLRVGAYHFWRPNDNAVAQAKWFLRHAGWNPDWLPHCLDLEVLSPGQSPRDAQMAIATWLEVVSQAMGTPCLLYTNPSTWYALGNPVNFAQHPLWLADYGVQAPPTIGGWADWTGWQFTSTGTIAGIPGDVDVSHWKP